MESLELNAEELFSKSVSADELGINNINTEDMEDLNSLLLSLNKQVVSVDNSVCNLTKKSDEILQRELQIKADRDELEQQKLEFEKEMKEEYDKLNSLKTEFENNKIRIYNDIQNTRETLARKEREFEKKKREELEMINRNKILLKKNYEQFNSIVTTFNKKIENKDQTN